MDLKPDTSPDLNKTIFSYTCQGYADSNPSKLIMRKGKVNKPAREVCQPIIRMAFNQWEGLFEVDMESGNMVKYVPSAYVYDLHYPYPYEILTSFFASQNLTPIWQDNNYNWGWFNEETGLWTGAVAMVSYYLKIGNIFSYE